MNRRITNLEPELPCPVCNCHPTLRRNASGLRYECVCPPTHSIQSWEDSASAAWKTLAWEKSFSLTSK